VALYIRPDFASTLSPSEQRFSHLFGLSGEIYREKEGRRTVRFHHCGKNYFLKVHTGVGWKEIAKNLIQLRLPIVSAKPEWRALHLLKELDIDTLTPVAFGSKGYNPARRQSFLVTEDLGDTVTLEDFLLPSVRRKLSIPVNAGLKRSMVRKVAEIAKRMHGNGINHRDFYLCHFRIAVSQLQLATPTQIPRIYLMDLHRAQVHRHRLRERWIVKDLAGLYFSSMDLAVTHRDRLRFIRFYSGQSLRETLTSRSRFWSKIDRRARRLYQKHHPA